MRTQRLAVLITMAFLVVGTSLLVVNVLNSPQVNADAQTEDAESETGPVVEEKGEFNVSEFISLLHEEINVRRSERGVGNLSHDKNLSLVAQSHSIWMESVGNISERENGISTRKRLEESGYECEAVSRNVLTASTTTLDEKEVAFGVVERWWLDESTRSSVLSGEHLSHGLGVVHTDDEELYVTQIMC